MTSRPITAAAARLLGACLNCAAGRPHTEHDTNLPAAQRSSVRTPARPAATR